MKVSLKQRAYRHIRSRIVDGVLVPGDRISHRELAKEIGVSFTPVREAINQLAEEGLVDCRSRQGTFISMPGVEDLWEIHDVRAGIERQLMEKLAGKVSPAVMAEVRALNAQLREIIEEFKQTGGRLWVAEEARKWLHTNAGIHMTLLCESGNRRAVKVLLEMQLVSIATGYLDQAPPLEGLLSAVEMHDRLFDALERGDVAAAGAVTKEHVEADIRGAVKAVEEGHMGRVKGWRGTEAEYTPSVARRMKEWGIS